MKNRIQLFLAVALALGVSEFATAAPISWNVSNGELGIAANWNPVTTIGTTGTWTIANSGTATVSSGSNYTLSSVLNVGDSAGKGTLVLNGNGSLTLSGGNMSVGNNGTGSGNVILKDTSKLSLAASLYVGHRTSGTVTVSAGSQVTAGTLIIGDGSNTANGLLDLSGTMNVGTVSLGSTNVYGSAKAALKINAGAALNSTGTLKTLVGAGTSLIELDGSGSTVNFAKGILANNALTTFEFLADAGGVTTITSGTNIDISNSILKLNIDDYTGTSNLVLFSTSAGGITGSFSSIEWLGTDHATVTYGVNSIYITDMVPEPSTLAIVGMGLGVMGVVAARRRQRTL